MSNSGKVYSVNTSKVRGTIKYPVAKGKVGNEGIIGDAHYGHSMKHISLINYERIEEFSQEAGREIMPGEFAENITAIGLSLDEVKLGDRFYCGNIVLEVVQIGKDEILEEGGVFRIIGKVVMVHEGIFCKVIHPGNIAVGDDISIEHK